MGERRQVSRRANGAACRNARVDIVVDQRAERFDQLETNAREPLGQCNDLHQHDQANDLVFEVLPDTDGM